MVVTGLPENPGSDDRTEFLKLCETHLSCKPYIVKCDRLGHVINGKPRRLLVRLSSDTAATELLRSAPALRRASDTLTANIYINPDLSPTEAKLAFEARQRRRERIAQRQATDADHAVDTANTTEDISVADQDPGTTAMTTTATTTTAPTATTSTAIVATTTPSSLSDTTVPVHTTKVPFHNQ